MRYLLREYAESHRRERLTHRDSKIRTNWEGLAKALQERLAETRVERDRFLRLLKICESEVETLKERSRPIRASLASSANRDSGPL